MTFIAYLQRGQYQTSNKPFQNVDINLGGKVLIRNAIFEPGVVVELYPVPKTLPNHLIRDSVGLN